MVLRPIGTLRWIKRLYGKVPTKVESITFKRDNSEVISVMGSMGVLSFAILRFEVITGTFI